MTKGDHNFSDDSILYAHSNITWLTRDLVAGKVSVRIPWVGKLRHWLQQLIPWEPETHLE